MADRSPVAGTLRRLDRWLRDHDPAYLAVLWPGATDADLDATDREIGGPLPAEVRAFYRWRDGIPARTRPP